MSIHESQKKWKEAAAVYTRFLVRFPKEKWGFESRAWVLHRWGDELSRQKNTEDARKRWRLALADYSYAAKVGSENPWIHLRSGFIHGGLGDRKAELAAFDRALQSGDPPSQAEVERRDPTSG